MIYLSCFLFCLSFFFFFFFFFFLKFQIACSSSSVLIWIHSPIIEFQEDEEADEDDEKAEEKVPKFGKSPLPLSPPPLFCKHTN